MILFPNHPSWVLISGGVSLDLSFCSPCCPCNCFLLAVSCVLVQTCQRDLPLTHCRQLTEVLWGTGGEQFVCKVSQVRQVAEWDAGDASCCSVSQQQHKLCIGEDCLAPPPPYLLPAQSPGWAESDLLQLDVASPTHQNCSCKSNQKFFFYCMRSNSKRFRQQEAVIGWPDWVSLLVTQHCNVVMFNPFFLI